MNHNRTKNLVRMSIALATVALLSGIAASAAAESRPLDPAGCSEAVTCGAVHAECVLQTVAAAGVSSDPDTEWTFTAYNSYGGQSYIKTGTGPVFADRHFFASGIGGIIQVHATLSANGQVVASAAIGCMF